MNLQKQFFRLSLQCSTWRCTCPAATTVYRPFTSSQVLFAEPTKKKKRVDSQLLIQKAVKRRNKLEKGIRKLEQKGRILKPIEEIDGNREFLRTIQQRKRESTHLVFEETERRAVLTKQWAQYKAQQHTREQALIRHATEARERAMDELRLHSEELYLEALKVDTSLIPFSRHGPVATPPDPPYSPPDGEVTNTTKPFDGETPTKKLDLVH